MRSAFLDHRGRREPMVKHISWDLPIANSVKREPSVSLRSQGPKDQRRGRGQFTVRLLAGDRQLASL
jgi:hypothetical protein